MDEELRHAIHNMVANISKSFIVEWYTKISSTNHDFVASCEELIEETMTKFAHLCTKLDRYKIGQLVLTLLRDHVLNDNNVEKIKSIESQIDNHEYDICQNTVVRLYGLLSNESMRRIIFTEFNDDQDDSSNELPARTTSALYTLVIAMLTKAALMPIIHSISEPKWLFAVIIWMCKNDQQASKSNNHKQPQDISRPRPPTSVIVTNSRGSRTLDLEEGIDIASTSINFDSPICDSLKRPLDNIEIYATEEAKTNTSCYVLYCIRFDGLCYRHPSAGGFIPEHPSQVPIIDKRQTHTSNRRWHEPSATIATNHVGQFASPELGNLMPADHVSQLATRKSFRRSMTIKRRFREFVLLQLRLEENPKIRPYMKNIPKPTKLKAATQNIFSLPGISNIKLDQSTIKLRQRFLERFLVALNRSPFIANSYEFKEFFSYNVNPTSFCMSKSKSTILQVNLNKVFVDSVRSAISVLRSTLPGDDFQSLETNQNPDAWLTEIQQNTLKLHIQTVTNHSKSNLERLIDAKLSEWDSNSNRSSLGKQYPRGDNLTKSSSIGSALSKSSSQSSSTDSVYYDACENSKNTKTATTPCNSIEICDSFPIASALIDIIDYSIRSNNTPNSIFNHIGKFLFGKLIEQRASHLLEAAFTVKNASFCVRGITSSIWDDSDETFLDVENANLDLAVEHLTKLVEQNYLNHSLLPKQLLNTLLRKQIKFYLSQLQSQRRNKFVIYSFLVHLLDELDNIAK